MTNHHKDRSSVPDVPRIGAEAADSPERTATLVNRVIRHGDVDALAELFAEYRPRLWRIVQFRLHPQLQGRIDADDVLHVRVEAARLL